MRERERDHFLLFMYNFFMRMLAGLFRIVDPIVRCKYTKRKAFHSQYYSVWLFPLNILAPCFIFEPPA